MHRRLSNRRSESGMTLIDVASASFVVAISLVGLVSTVVYQRNLEDQTVRLWEAAGTATATLEDLRADSRRGWSSLTASWEGYGVQTKTRYTKTASTIDDTIVLADADVAALLSSANVATFDDFLAGVQTGNISASLQDQYTALVATAQGTIDTARAAELMEKSMLRVRVSDDVTKLDDGAEMWTSGETAPNFYHVTVSAGSGDNEFANALNFQTYVTDRTGLEDTQAVVADTGGATATAPVAFSDDAERVNPTPTSAAVSGADDDVLTVSFENWSSDNIAPEKLTVTFKDGGKFVTLVIAGEQVYNGARTSEKTADILQAGAAIVPGTFDVQVTGVSEHREPAVLEQRIEIEIEFADGSSIKTDVLL